MTQARVVGVAIAAFICAGAASGQVPVEVRTSVSRTAVWPGDRTIYTVELRCAPQVDVLFDDLAGRRLRIDGGDIVDVQEDHDDSGQGAIRRFRYTLVTYRVDVPELRIAAIPVRYYLRRGGVQQAPSGQVMVPPALVAVRSVIPDGEGTPSPRVPAELRHAPRYLELAQQMGLVLIVLALVPVVVMSVDVAARARGLWTRIRVRRSDRRNRESLEDLRAVAPVSSAERIQAFDRLDGLVREHLTLTASINARALTPTEIRLAMERHEPARPASDIESLLTVCERARYAPDPPAAEAWTRAVQDAEQIIAAVNRR
jgi:hypothetical protein